MNEAIIFIGIDFFYHASFPFIQNFVTFPKFMHGRDLFSRCLVDFGSHGPGLCFLYRGRI